MAKRREPKPKTLGELKDGDPDAKPLLDAAEAILKEFDPDLQEFKRITRDPRKAIAADRKARFGPMHPGDFRAKRLEFAALQLDFGDVRKPKGRKKGTSLETADAPYVEELERRIAKGEGREAAALAVAKQKGVPGGGTPGSKARRLLRRLRGKAENK